MITITELCRGVLLFQAGARNVSAGDKASLKEILTKSPVTSFTLNLASGDTYTIDFGKPVQTRFEELESP